jgi:hypothetical protein
LKAEVAVENSGVVADHFKYPADVRGQFFHSSSRQAQFAKRDLTATRFHERILECAPGACYF